MTDQWLEVCFNGKLKVVACPDLSPCFFHSSAVMLEYCIPSNDNVQQQIYFNPKVSVCGYIVNPSNLQPSYMGLYLTILGSLMVQWLR